MWSFIGKHVLSKTAFLGHLKCLKNGVWQRFKRFANSFQTLANPSQTTYKRSESISNIFQTVRKRLSNGLQSVSNTSQTLCERFSNPLQMLLKPFANASQTLCKRFANPWQTLFKPFQTFHKPFANASLESRQNKSALATKRALKLWLVFNTLPSGMNCFFNIK